MALLLYRASRTFQRPPHNEFLGRDDTPEPAGIGWIPYYPAPGIPRHALQSRPTAGKVVLYSGVQHSPEPPR